MSNRAFYQVRCDQHRCNAKAGRTFYVKPESAVKKALEEGWQNLVKDGVATDIWFCPWHHTGQNGKGPIIAPSLLGYSFRDRLNMATEQLLSNVTPTDYTKPPDF